MKASAPTKTNETERMQAEFHDWFDAQWSVRAQTVRRRHRLTNRELKNAKVMLERFCWFAWRAAHDKYAARPAEERR